MEGNNKIIIVRPGNKGIFLNNLLKVELENTNLPVHQFIFTEDRTVFWEVEMISFDKGNATLFVKIINYRPTQTDRFIIQKPKSEIKKLSFSEIFWPAFCTDLSYFKKSAFLHLLTEKIPVSVHSNQKILHIKASVPFKKIRFGMGFVEFDYKLLWRSNPVLVKINNSHLLPEFEYIKSFFSRHFNSRNFEVLMVIKKSTNGEILSIDASSGQIEMIKDFAIETLKFLKIEQLRKTAKIVRSINKNLFTAEDIFDPYTDIKSNPFAISQNELLEQIMKWENIRNKKQLEFLAGFLQSTNEKIRFTLTPQFGFLFYVSGKSMVHYIWEMLNTNATYIWSFDPVRFDKTYQISQLEANISYIRMNGRESYIRNIDLQSEIIFRRINHKGAGSQFVDHFPKWRHQILETIV